jgi:hypothetical protein
VASSSSSSFCVALTFEQFLRQRKLHFIGNKNRGPIK